MHLTDGTVSVQWGKQNEMTQFESLRKKLQNEKKTKKEIKMTLVDKWFYSKSIDIIFVTN